MNAAPSRVLNVNDDDSARYVTTRILRRAGYEVLEAATGRQALYMASTLPDVIVLDVNLPDMDGFEVCRRLRDNPKTSTLRVLHLSAVRVHSADRVEGLETGADAYLTQPVTPDEILATVKSLLRAREAELSARTAAEQWQATFDSITDAVALIDERGVVTKCNLAFAALYRQPLSGVVGKPISSLAGAATNEVLERMRHSRARGTSELQIEGQWFRVTEDPVFDASGAVTGAVQMWANITAAKAAHEALRESEERFRLLIGGVRDYAIVMLDGAGRIASWNDGAQRITGFQSSEILGQHVSCFYPAEALRTGEPMREIDRAKVEGRVQIDGWRVRKDGSRFWAETLLTAVRDENDALRGLGLVVRDITERKMLHEELQHRAAALEEADRRKDEFLAMLGHELRNPLAAIKTALAILDRTAPPETNGAKPRAIIGRQVSHLARLVDDLLDVSRITRGLIQLRKEPLDALAAVERALETTKSAVEGRKHRVTFARPEAPIPFEADPLRFEQILSNLLLNAAKYMDPGGHIRVTVEREEIYVVFRIRDEGIGIAPHVLPRIFDLFAQADVPLDRSQGGLGIGLTIVKSLVELHGGTVAAYSDGPGLGAEFVVRLPHLGKATPPVAPPAPAALLPAPPAASPPGALAPPPAQLEPRRRRVLLVEDNLDAREALESLLQFWGHDVSSAPDGETGLHMALTRRPDVVLLDIGLPGVNGYEVARKIRSVPEGQGLYLVAMTGYGTNDDKTRAMEAGFNVHLVKPVDAEDLSRLLNELWQIRKI